MTAAGQLIIQLEGYILQTVALTPVSLTIGRTPDNGLVLPHPLVSRRHAEVRLEAEGAMLTDLGSSNGTVVDDTRLLPHQPYLLAEGTVIQIGPFILTYTSGQPQAGEADPSPVEDTADLAPVEDIVEDTAALVARLPAAAPPMPAGPRASLPMELAREPVSRYLYDLPIIYHDNEFLGRFLLIFESLWEPLEQRQDHIAMYFDSHTCPASFLPWLAKWLGFPLDSRWSEARRRHLIAEAMDLYRWRGTRYGLTRMIEICTGLTPEIREDLEQPLVFHIRMRIPPESEIERTTIEEVVRIHKPAHVGYILELQP